MKKILLTACFVLFAVHAIAAEKKHVKDIDIDEFTNDTQVTAAGSGDNHVAMTWWIPNEFWKSIMARDVSTNETDKNAMLTVIKDISLLAVVQADVSQFGAFRYYPKDAIQKKLSISYTDASGKNTVCRR